MKPVKRNGKRLLALTLALLLCAALLPTAALAETYSGTTVRLEKTEGTVTVKNAAGEVKSLSGRPRLSGGWTVKTEAASYAWLSFDADSGNTLSVKLDANTLVEVRKNGGKNEVLLKNNGRLIAGSEKPLSGGQTLSVGNSSGVCGVRGSMLIATDDQFMFLFGHGVASGRDGAAQKTELAAGQGVAYGAGGSMRRFEVQTAQISGFAQVELADNPVLAQQMYEQTAGRLDLRELTAEQALQQQRTDEARAALLRGGSTAGSLSVPGGSRLRLEPAWGVGGRFNKSTTVYFYANGGTGYMPPVVVTGALQVPACEFTRDGYTFTGWKDDHGMDHPVGSYIQGGASGTFGEQLTLYAQWQANSGGGNVLPYVPVPEPVPAKYAVTVSDGIENGTVTADKAAAAAGETVTLTVTPATGYAIDSVSYMEDGADKLTAITSTEGVYSFAMPAKAVTVSAEFARAYTITLDAFFGETQPLPEDCTVTVMVDGAAAERAQAGKTVTLMVSPAEKYEFPAELVSCKTAESDEEVAVQYNDDGTCSFLMPEEDVIVNAMAWYIEYRLTYPKPTANGCVKVERGEGDLFAETDNNDGTVTAVFYAGASIILTTEGYGNVVNEPARRAIPTLSYTSGGQTAYMTLPDSVETANLVEVDNVQKSKIVRVYGGNTGFALPLSDVTVTLDYEEVKLIHFAPQNDSNETMDLVTSDSSIVLPACTFTHPIYPFACWEKELTDNQTKQYRAGETYQLGDAGVYWLNAFWGYTVTVDDGIVGGTVTADRIGATEETWVTLTITTADHYAISSVSYKYLIDGTETTTVIEPVDGVYSFQMPGSNVIVTATYAVTN